MARSWRASEIKTEHNNQNIRENEKNAFPKKYKDPLIQRTNAEEWRLEVERVAPSLKMTVKTDGRWTLKISFPILFFSVQC